MLRSQPAFHWMSENDKKLLQEFLNLCTLIHSDITGQASIIKDSHFQQFKDMKTSLAILLHPDKLIGAQNSEAKTEAKDEEKKLLEEKQLLGLVWQSYNTLLRNFKKNNYNNFKNSDARREFTKNFSEMNPVYLHLNKPSEEEKTSAVNIQPSADFPRKPKPSAKPNYTFTGLDDCRYSSPHILSQVWKAGSRRASETLCLELNTIIQEENLLNLPLGLENVIANVFVKLGAEIGSFTLALLDDMLTELALKKASHFSINLLLTQLGSYLTLIETLQTNKTAVENIIGLLKTRGNPQLVAQEIARNFGAPSYESQFKKILDLMGMTSAADDKVTQVFKEFIGDTMGVRAPLKTIIRLSLQQSGQLVGGMASEVFVKYYIRDQISNHIRARLNTLLGDVMHPVSQWPEVVPLQLNISDIANSSFEILSFFAKSKNLDTYYLKKRDEFIQNFKKNLLANENAKKINEMLQPSIMGWLGSAITQTVHSSAKRYQAITDYLQDNTKKRDELCTYVNEICMTPLEETNMKILLKAFVEAGDSLNIDVLNVEYAIKEIKLKSDDQIKTFDLSLTPLMLAVVQNNSKACKTLLESGRVDVNQTTCFGITPLHLACMLGHDEVTRVFCDYHQSINKFDLEISAGKTAATPLATAIYYGHVKIVDQLISAGADIHALLEGDSTLLHIACLSSSPNKYQIIENLLNRGLNVSSVNLDNKSPFSYISHDELHNNKSLITSKLNNIIIKRLKENFSNVKEDNLNELRSLIEIAFQLDILAPFSKELQLLFSYSLQHNHWHYAEKIMIRYGIECPSILPELLPTYLYGAAKSTYNVEYLVDMFLERLHYSSEKLSQELLQLLKGEKLPHIANLRTYLAHGAHLEYRNTQDETLIKLAITRHHYDFAALIFNKIPLSNLQEAMDIFLEHQNKWFFQKWFDNEMNKNDKKDLVVMYLYLASYAQDRSPAKWKQFIDQSLTVFKRSVDKELLCNIISQISQFDKTITDQSQSTSSAPIKSTVKKDVTLLLIALLNQQISPTLELFLKTQELHEQINWGKIFHHLIKAGYYSEASMLLDNIPQEINTLARSYEYMQNLTRFGFTPQTVKQGRELFDKTFSHLVIIQQPLNDNEKKAFQTLFTYLINNHARHDDVKKLLNNDYLRSGLKDHIQHIAMDLLLKSDKKALLLILDYQESLPLNCKDLLVTAEEQNKKYEQSSRLSLWKPTKIESDIILKLQKLTGDTPRLT